MSISSLTAYNVSKPFPCTLHLESDPDEKIEIDGKPVVFHVLSRSSEKARNLMVDFARANPVETKEDETEEEKQARQLIRNIEISELFVTELVTGWDNVALDDGQLPFNQDNLKRVYEEAPWIKAQILTFLMDTKNFNPKTLKG